METVKLNREVTFHAPTLREGIIMSRLYDWLVSRSNQYADKKAYDALNNEQKKLVRSAYVDCPFGFEEVNNMIEILKSCGFEGMTVTRPGHLFLKEGNGREVTEQEFAEYYNSLEDAGMLPKLFIAGSVHPLWVGILPLLV